MTETIAPQPWICGASRGRYGAPWRIDGPRGVKSWVSENYRKLAAPKKVRCGSPKHQPRRFWYPREDCFVQKWRLTKREFYQAIEAHDIFSLTMPPRFLCPECAKRVRAGA